MSMRLRAAFVALAVAVAGLAVGSFARPAAADPPWDPLKYHLAYNGKCLEADLSHITWNGDAAQLWDCWNDAGNQQFTPYPIGGRYASTSVFKLQNGDGGKCLEGDLSHSGNGTPVQLWDCWNDPGNQQWREITIPATIWVPITQYKLQNVLTGLCLDADLTHIDQNGDRMQLWDCYGDSGNQRWTTTAVPNEVP